MGVAAPSLDQLAIGLVGCLHPDAKVLVDGAGPRRDVEAAGGHGAGVRTAPGTRTTQGVSDDPARRKGTDARAWLCNSNARRGRSSSRDPSRARAANGASKG